MGDFELVLEESFDLQQLTQVPFTLHQGQMLLDVIQYIGDTPGIQVAEIQVKREVPCLGIVLNHVLKQLLNAQLFPYRGGETLHKNCID